MGIKNHQNRFPAIQCGTGGVNPGSIQGAAQRFAMFGHYTLLPFVEQTALYQQFEAINWNPWENGTAPRKLANKAKVP